MSAELYLCLPVHSFRKTEIKFPSSFLKLSPNNKYCLIILQKRVCPQSFFFLERHNLNKPKLFHENYCK